MATNPNRLAYSFKSPEEVRHFSTLTGQRLEEMGLEVSLAATVIQATLRRLPDSSLGFSSRVRSVWVVRSLHVAAKLCDAAAGHVAATYPSFVKQFSRELGGE
jgi:hypothetical protein